MEYHCTGDASGENLNRSRSSNAKRRQRPKNSEADRGQSKVANLTLTMKDVLELVPTYSGDDMCEFVRFAHGCREALSLVGSENERALLLFLKLKLKGLIYSELSLHMSKYTSIDMFLYQLEKEYPDIDRVTAWRDEFHRLHQKEYEPIDLYARRFQYILQCVRIQLKCDYVIDRADRCHKSLVMMDDWERVAKYYFIQNLMSVKLQKYLVEKYDLEENLDGLMRTAYSHSTTLKASSTCKLCFEDDHVNDDCIAMERNYYASFKESTSEQNYKIINHHDDEYPYPATVESLAF